MNNCEHEFYYYLNINEEGWRCVNCDERPGEPPGFSPRLDRDMTEIKAGSVLMDLHDSAFVHISNGTSGDILANQIAKRCHQEGRFDQYTILLFILEALAPSHAEYWRNISEGILCGNDPRDRCKCGKLANMWTGGTHYCSLECAGMQTIFDAPARAAL